MQERLREELNAEIAARDKAFDALVFHAKRVLALKDELRNHEHMQSEKGGRGPANGG